MDELVKEQKIQEITKKVEEIVDLSTVEDLLKNNEVEFEFNGQKYRIKRPTSKQREEAHKKRIEYFTKLLDEVDENGNPKYKLEEDLKKAYLKRGIDINAMEDKVKLLVTKRGDLLLKLGEALKNKLPDTELLAFKKEIDDINHEINDIVIKKTQLLEFSIEKQCIIYLCTYLTYLLTEKKENEDKWIRVWNTWDEFQNADEYLVNKSSYYTALIISPEFEL